MNDSYCWSGCRWSTARLCVADATRRKLALRPPCCVWQPAMMSPLLTRQSQHSCWYGFAPARRGACGRDVGEVHRLAHMWSLSKSLLIIWHIYLPRTPTHKHINSVSCTCPLQHTLKPLTVLMKMLIVVLPSSFKFNKSFRICSWRCFFPLFACSALIWC